MRRIPLFSMLAVVVVVGCKNPDNDLEPGFVPKSYAFEGEVDPKLVGRWVSTDGVSTLDLRKDGALKIRTLTSSPGGKGTSDVEGKWLASPGGLLMQYGNAGQGDTVLKYSSTLAKDELKLKQEGARSEKTYRRK